MMSTSRILVLVAYLIALVASVSSQCILPTEWKTNPNTGSGQMWRGDPETARDLIYIFTDAIFVDVIKGIQYTCIDSRLENGFTLIRYRTPDLAIVCFYGRTSNHGNNNKALLYKRSVESKVKPPNSLDECASQAGILGDVYTIMVKNMLATETWAYNINFPDSTDPLEKSGWSDGQYLFQIKKAPVSGMTRVFECVDQANSILTKIGTTVTVSSPCISTTPDSYLNPFGKRLRISDYLTDNHLNLPPKSGQSGFLIMNQENPADGNKPYRFYVAKYEIDQTGTFNMYMETVLEDFRHKGYWAMDSIPDTRGPITISLKSTLCLSGTFCKNGGTCIPGFTTATCKCPDGFEDNTCSTPVNKCIPNPCLQNGVCTQITTGLGFSCTCPTGYTGDTCQLIDKCVGTGAVVCQNAGQCKTIKTVAGVDTGYCVCTSPYRGARCELYDPCVALPCQNGGVCLTKEAASTAAHFRCQCQPGFSGDRCEKIGGGVCDPNPCQNGGTCGTLGNTYKCTCKTGYSGTNCQVGTSDTCDLNPCKNEGKCMKVGDGVYCECRSQFKGAFCEEYEDWFIIFLVMIILLIIIIVIIIILCSCYCCCGWKGGNVMQPKTPYQSYQANQPYNYPTLPAEPIPDSVQFNFVSPNQFMAMEQIR